MTAFQICCATANFRLGGDSQSPLSSGCCHRNQPLVNRWTNRLLQIGFLPVRPNIVDELGCRQDIGSNDPSHVPRSVAADP
jgi:hypothetical protein